MDRSGHGEGFCTQNVAAWLPVSPNSAGTGTAQAAIGNVNNGISLDRTTSGRVSFGGYDWTLSPAHPGDEVVLWGTGGGADFLNDAGGSVLRRSDGGGQLHGERRRTTIVPLCSGTFFGYRASGKSTSFCLPRLPRIALPR